MDIDSVANTSLLSWSNDLTKISERLSLTELIVLLETEGVFSTELPEKVLSQFADTDLRIALLYLVDTLTESESSSFFNTPLPGYDGKWILYFSSKIDGIPESIKIMGVDHQPTITILGASIPLFLCNAQVISSENFMSKYRSLEPKFTKIARAILLGVLESAFLEAKRYADRRIQGGKRISYWTLISSKMNELKSQIEVVRTHKNPFIINLPNFGLNCIKIFGGAGYIKDYPIEKKYRELLFLDAFFNSAQKLFKIGGH